MKRISSVALAAVLLCAMPPHALAADDDVALEFTMYILPPVAAVGGLITTITNGVIAGRGRRPHLGWLTAGILFGALDLGVGAWLLTYARSGYYNYNLAFGAGLPGVLLGGAGIAMSIWGWTRPREAARASSLSFLPRFVVSADGRSVSLMVSVQGP